MALKTPDASCGSKDCLPMRCPPYLQYSAVGRVSGSNFPSASRSLWHKHTVYSVQRCGCQPLSTDGATRRCATQGNCADFLASLIETLAQISLGAIADREFVAIRISFDTSRCGAPLQRATKGEGSGTETATRHLGPGRKRPPRYPARVYLSSVTVEAIRHHSPSQLPICGPWTQDPASPPERAPLGGQS